MLVGEVLSPASIPQDVLELFRIGAPAAPVVERSKCAPYPCPGQYVPLGIPYEVIRDLSQNAMASIPDADLVAIQQWFGDPAHPIRRPTSISTLTIGTPSAEALRFPQTPPVEWSTDRRARMLEWEKLQAELWSRLNYFMILIQAYKPWTSLEVCAACKFWNEEGWRWKNATARKIEALSPKPRIMTCGLLRDAGIVHNVSECIDEDTAMMEAYLREMDERFPPSSQNMIGIYICLAIVTIVIAVVTWGTGTAAEAAALSAGMTATEATIAGGAAAAAAGAVTSISITAATTGKFDVDSLAEAGITFLGNIVSLGIGGTLAEVATYSVKVAKMGYELSNSLKERAKVESAIKEQKDAIDQSIKNLHDTIKAKATLEELMEASRQLDTQIAAVKGKGVEVERAGGGFALASSAGTIGWIAAGAAGLLALVLLLRR